MRIEKFVFGPVGTNCYIVINEMTSECFAVDMADCPQEFVKHIKDAGLCVKALLLTHGHFDHIGTIKDLKNHQQIELGNFEIEVLALPGHTPGSMIFLDRQNKCIYTGDAIGSGCGVWLQLFHSLDLKTYHTALQQTIDYLEKQGVDDTWHFWGGHNQQEIQSKISAYNKLDFVLMKDLEQLCLKLINSEITGIKNSAPTFDDNQAYYASYGKAEIIYQKNSL